MAEVTPGDASPQPNAMENSRLIVLVKAIQEAENFDDLFSRLSKEVK